MGCMFPRDDERAMDPLSMIPMLSSPGQRCVVYPGMQSSACRVDPLLGSLFGCYAWT